MATQAEIEAARERWGNDFGDDKLNRYATIGDRSVSPLEKLLPDAVVLADAFVSQQPVNERLLKVITKVRDYYDSLAELFDADLAEDIREAISAAEAEIENRRKPVTEEWLKLRGWDHCGTRGRCNIYSPSINVESIRIEFGLKTTLLFDSLCKISPTRGDVMIIDDLLRVLGGAK